MPIKKSLFILMVLYALLLPSCQQNMNLVLRVEENRLAGTVQSRLVLQPIFAMYLKNLDMFSGIEVPQDSLPTSVSDPLLDYSQNQSNYRQNTVYDPKTGKYTVDFSFDFFDFTTVAQTHIESIMSDIVSVKNENGITTIEAVFNEKNRQTIEQYLPILLPLPEEKNTRTEKAYLVELGEMIVESQQQVGKAEKEIVSSKVVVHVTTPRPIIDIQGGKITDSEHTKAVLEIPLTRIIFLQKDQTFSLTF